MRKTSRYDPEPCPRRRGCQVYRRRRDAMLDALSRYLPAGVRYLPPHGGLFVWLQLPGELSANRLYPVAAGEGVTFTPGSLFFPAERAQPYLQLNFAMHPPDVIGEGIRRLGRAVEHLLAHQESEATLAPRQKAVVV